MFNYLSVRGVMTRRGVQPRYSCQYLRTISQLLNMHKYISPRNYRNPNNKQAHFWYTISFTKLLVSYLKNCAVYSNAVVQIYA